MAFDCASGGCPGRYEDGQTSVWHLLFHRGPGCPADALVFKVDAGDVQGQPTFLATAHGSVEVNEFGLVHE